MLYACDTQGKKITAHPQHTAACPVCHSPVIAKCGAINMWHWAHKHKHQCDSWSTSETDWHLQWKSLFPKEYVEVPVIKHGKKHIADVRFPNGVVIEFQHSSLSPDNIQEREQFYQRMYWVFDIIDCCHEHEEEVYGEYADGFGGMYVELSTLHYPPRFDIRHKGNYCTFRWFHPRKHIMFTHRPTFLDVGDNKLFQLKKIHQETPCGGWGYLIQREKFLAFPALQQFTVKDNTWKHEKTL